MADVAKRLSERDQQLMGKLVGQPFQWPREAWEAIINRVGDELLLSASQIIGSTGATVYRKSTEEDVANTTNETDLLNAEITVGGDVMGADGVLRATLLGDYLNNTAAARASTVKVKLGGTTIFDDTANINASATRRDWFIRVYIANLASAASQQTVCDLGMSPAATPTAGLGNLDADVTAPSTVAATGYSVFGSSGTTSVDTSVASALEVTITHPTASTNLSWRLKHAFIEII